MKGSLAWQCTSSRGGKILGADKIKKKVAILPGGDLRYRLWLVETEAEMVPLSEKTRLHLSP